MTLLLAGAARRDISPRKPVFLVGYPGVERTSTGVHDPLLASALCLKNGDAAVLLVAVDILYISLATARELRAGIARRTEIDEAGIFISATHTHSGPVTSVLASWGADAVVPAPDPEYMTRFKAGIVDAAVASAESLRPAELAWTSANAAGAGSNRLSPEGAVDPEVGLLLVRDAAGGAPIASAAIYSMHPTVLHQDSTLVSADFPAFVREEVSAALGGDAPGLYHTGPAGNQSPRYFVKSQSFEEAERLGRFIGSRAASALSSLRAEDFDADPELAGRLKSVTLPAREMPSVAAAERLFAESVAEFERLKREGAAHGITRSAECATFGAEETLTLARLQANGELARFITDYSQPQVQVLSIGDGSLVGFPGELFVEYGLEIKARSPRRTFAVSLVGGELQGYIVTPEAAAAGGYEAANSLFAPESGQIMVEAALELLADPFTHEERE
jgi:Neutral/alkaline non-lysosomal ceramidase, N-terminal